MAGYCSNEEKLIDAISFRNAHRSAAVADMFGINDSTLRHRANGRQSRSTRPPTNRKLSDAQNKALVNYIMQLYNIGVPFRQKHIAAAAESILRDAIAGRDSDPIGEPPHHPQLSQQPPRQPDKATTVSDRWAGHWIKRHRELMVIIDKIKRIYGNFLRHIRKRLTNTTSSHRIFTTWMRRAYA
jgi:Tc5 transposase DNA-binding domain